MRRERVLEVEIEAALREHGVASPNGVELVVLETDGSFSIIPSQERISRRSS